MIIPKKLGFYTIKSFILPFVIMSVMLVIVFIVQDFIQRINFYLNKVENIEQLFLYYLYWSPKMFFMIFPLAILFSVVYLISNLNYHFELLAIHSSGISTLQLSIPLLAFILFMTLFFTFTQDYFVTNTYKKKLEFEEKVFKKKIKKDNYYINKKGLDNKFFIVRKYIAAKKEIYNIKILKFDKYGNIIYSIEATKGKYNIKKKCWTLYNIKEIYYYTPPVYQYYKVKNYYFKEKPVFFERSTGTVETMSIGEAYSYIKMLRNYNIKNFLDEYAFWQKFSLPLGGFIISFFGIAAGTLFRKNILVNALMTCLAVFGVYYYILNTLFELGRRGIGSAFFAAWTGNVVFIILGIIAIIKVKN